MLDAELVYLFLHCITIGSHSIATLLRGVDISILSTETNKGTHIFFNRNGYNKTFPSECGIVNFYFLSLRKVRGLSIK